MPLISIIVPVYKVEPYLRRCLDSVLAQTFTDYECILVDDGSPDNCPSMCDGYAARDARFRVIHKPQNEGLPKARKSGLNSASGEFVMHVDSDDWLEPQALELLHEKQRETGADIVIGGHKIIYAWGNETVVSKNPGDAMKPAEYFLANNTKSIWAKLYRKTLFDGYVVPEMSIGEDLITNAQLFMKTGAGKLRAIEDMIYNYDYRTDGMSQKTGTCFSSYLEYPSALCRLWIEGYLDAMAADEKIKDAFNYCFVKEAVNPYLRFNRNISRKEVTVFYRKYYRNCTRIGMIPLRFRLIVPLYYFSLPAGKLYVHVLNALIHLSRIFFKNRGG